MSILWAFRNQPVSQVHLETLFLKAKGEFAGALKPESHRIFDMDGKTMGGGTLPDAALDDRDPARNRACRAVLALS